MELPRFRCAIEVGFLLKPQEIYIHKNDMKAGFGARVEQGDEFVLAEDVILGGWMEPINDAADLKAKAAVQAKKRKQVGAVNAAPTTALVVPRSGLAGSAQFPTQIPSHAVRDVQTDERAPTPTRAAPRRRAAAS